MSPRKGAEPPLIYSYTRAQALEDGVLVDVSELASEAGFRFPVAMTATAYGRYVEVPKAASWQDLTGRLWDVLWMLRDAIRRTPDGQAELLFKLYVDNGKGPKLVTLKSLCGPGDNGEPAITVMLPDED